MEAKYTNIYQSEYFFTSHYRTPFHQWKSPASEPEIVEGQKCPESKRWLSLISEQCTLSLTPPQVDAVKRSFIALQLDQNSFRETLFKTFCFCHFLNSRLVVLITRFLQQHSEVNPRPFFHFFNSLDFTGNSNKQRPPTVKIENQ